jgi:hypothetical protein
MDEKGFENIFKAQVPWAPRTAPMADHNWVVATKNQN